VVRITTNLVQVDAVVTDKKGQAITDLTAGDFEILENGQPQPITNFSFVEVAPRAASYKSAEKMAAPAKNAPHVPHARISAEQVRRTITLVVDDLTMSFFSMGTVKDTLTKFVNEQMQPGDMVAIIRASAGIGALEQFTNDKRQLLAAIERVRWYPREGAPVQTFEPIRREQRSGSARSGGENPYAAYTREMEQTDKQNQQELKDYREQVSTVGTLGTLNYTVRGMKGVPGRKAVVLLSDGMRIFDRKDLTSGSRVTAALRQLTDMANRSAVVFYTVDARGLVNPAQFYADDDTSGDGAQLDSRLREYIDSQTGLDYLAHQTGGMAIRNNNDLNGGIRRVLDHQKSFYLIGYRPDPETFKSSRDGRAFHKISVRVKRPELRVRARTGFLGIADEELRVVPRTRDERLMNALVSPISTGGIDVRLTSLFLNDEQAGSFMRSLLHLDARDLTFTTEPDGRRKVVIDIAALTFGDAGTMVDSFNRTHTIHVSESAYQAALQQGLRYEIAMPVKKAGPYQMRIAVRDAGTDRIGSVSQFIEVLNLSKGLLALSGLLLSSGAGQEMSQTKALQTLPARSQSPRTLERLNASSNESDSAVRRFHVGTPLDYGFVIYNAKVDKTTSRPQLTRQIRLFRDGQLVHTSEPQPLDKSG
jgi:VWFA-related protein